MQSRWEYFKVEYHQETRYFNVFKVWFYSTVVVCLCIVVALWCFSTQERAVANIERTTWPKIDAHIINLDGQVGSAIPTTQRATVQYVDPVSNVTKSANIDLIVGGWKFGDTIQTWVKTETGEVFAPKRIGDRPFSTEPEVLPSFILSISSIILLIAGIICIYTSIVMPITLKGCYASAQYKEARSKLRMTS